LEKRIRKKQKENERRRGGREKRVRKVNCQLWRWKEKREGGHGITGQLGKRFDEMKEI
jgi:hypothetical protein